MKKNNLFYKDLDLINPVSKNVKNLNKGFVQQFFENGKKFSETFYKNDGDCYGIYKRFAYNGIIHWMDTNKSRAMNGIQIIFNF